MQAAMPSRLAERMTKPSARRNAPAVDFRLREAVFRFAMLASCGAISLPQRENREAGNGAH
jgi:hypothetical protein